MYEVKLRMEELVKKLKEKNVKKILLLPPEGLKPKMKVLVDKLTKEGFEVFIWMGPNYGGCDIPPVDWVDVIVNFHRRSPRWLEELMKLVEDQ